MKQIYLLEVENYNDATRYYAVAASDSIEKLKQYRNKMIKDSKNDSISTTVTKEWFRISDSILFVD